MRTCPVKPRLQAGGAVVARAAGHSCDHSTEMFQKNGTGASSTPFTLSRKAVG